MPPRSPKESISLTTFRARYPAKAYCRRISRLPPLPRRVAAAAAAGGLALAALGLTGCDYPADGGSYVLNTFAGCASFGAATAFGVADCSSVMISEIEIRNQRSQSQPPETVDVLTMTNGQSRSLISNWFATETKDNKSTGPYVWRGLLDWGQSFSQSASVTQYVVSERTAGIFSDRWFLNVEVPTKALALPPTPVASLFSHDSPAARGPAPLKPTIVDARQSTGTGLAYSWDTNGDGIFGDDPTGGWTGVSAPTTGTAYLPEAVLASSIPAPSVKVTDSGNQTATKSISIPTWDQGAGRLAVAPGADGQISLTPDIGSLPIGNDAVGHVHYACIDIGDDGTYDTQLPQIFVGVNPPYAPTGFFEYLAPAWAGVKRVRVAFFADDPTPFVERGACSAPAPLATVLSTHIELVNGDNRTAMERGPRATSTVKRYTGTARVRLTGGAVLDAGTQTGRTVTGVINRGRYTLRTPARGGGVPRPTALAAFASGDFASTSTASMGFTAAGEASIVGTTTMLIRGKAKARACLTVAQTDSSTTWTVMGGTAGARTLRMVMNGGATLNSLITTAVPVNAKVTGKGNAASMALSPASISYTINASRGAARGLSPACRALAKRLP